MGWCSLGNPSEPIVVVVGFALTSLDLTPRRHCLKFSDYVRMGASALTHGAYPEFRRWSRYP